jgi:hypothetical protein
MSKVLASWQKQPPVPAAEIVENKWWSLGGCVVGRNRIFRITLVVSERIVAWKRPERVSHYNGPAIGL